MDKTPLRILLVEDNLTDVLLLEDALEEAHATHATHATGHTLTHVQRLDDALRHLHEQGFDIALLDLGLPDSAGLETFARLQREHPTIPILILSGMDDEALAIRAVQDGAQDFVVKGKLPASRLARIIRYAVERKQTEQRLMASEASYRQLFESAQDGIFILDAETGRITDANPALEKLLGYTCEEMEGKRLWEIAPFRDRAANLAAFRTLKEKGDIRYEDLPLAAKDGRFIPVEFVSNVHTVGDKRIMQCNIRDITERKRAEERIRASEASLAAAQKMAHLGSWELDLANLDEVNANPLRWSDEIFRIFGYEPGAFEPSNEAFFHAVHPNDRENIQRMMTEAVQGRTSYSLDHRILLPDGSERIVYEQAEMVLDPHTGAPVKMMGMVQDITDRTRADARLSFQKAFLESQAEASPDGFLALSDEGEVLSYNQRYLQMWGIPPDVAAAGDNARFRRIVLDQVADPDKFLEKAQYLYSHRDERSNDEVVLLDGRIFDRYSSPITGADGLYHGRVWYFRDISERKKAEIVLRESEEYLRFVVDASNDGIFEWEVASGKVSWSERIYTLLALSPKTFEPSYEAQRALIHPDDLPRFKEAVQAHLEADQPYHIQVRYRRRDGSYLHVLLQGRTQRDDAGRPLRMVGSFSDLTSLMQAEAEREAKSREIVTIWESMTDAFFSVDTEWRFTHVNSQAAEAWQVNAEELIGKNIWERFPRAVGLRFYDEYHRAINEQTPVHFEGFYSPLNRWREVRAYPSSAGLAVYFRDITERKRGEALLRESQQRLALATESARIGTWDWDVAANTLVWDAQMYALYGIEEQDFTGAYAVWQNGLHPDDRVKAEAELMEALKGDAGFHTEFRVVWPSGEVRHTEAHAIALRADDGSVLRMIGVNWDITERKRADEALRKSLGMLEAVKEGTTDAIFLKDRDGRYLMVNTEGARRLGMTPEEMQGQNSADHFDPAMARGLREADRKVMATGQTITYEEVGTAAGETRVLLTTKTPYRDAAGEIIGVIGIARDITEQKRLQAKMVQSERLAAMGGLVAGVAHEINNPLAAISGQAQLLQMHPDPQVQEDGQAIKRMTDRAIRIVRSLLTFARQGKDAERVPTPLCPLIEEALEIVRYNLRKGNVELALDLAEPDVYPVVNPGQIEQVLLNLVNNAEHALRECEGDKQITITSRLVREEEREWAEIRVSDNGPGIPQAVQDRMFDPFFTTKPQGEGTGLGLSICHGIVAEHGGRLEVSSRSGVGPTFTLTLPITPDPAEDAAALGEVAAPSVGDGGKI